MNRALAIAAHPDDIEFLMAGTLLQLKKSGFEIHYLNLASGNCGSSTTNSNETAAIRLMEAREAASQAGAVFHDPICDDLEIFYDKSNLSKVAAIVRRVAPTIVLTHSPEDYMEDHTNTCRLAVTAAFSRGMCNFTTSPPVPPTAQNLCLYHAQPYGNRTPLGELVQPSILVNTAGLLAQKTALLSVHRSQQSWLDQSQGLNSYLQKMQELDLEVGKWSTRFRCAEGWRQHLSTGLGALDSNLLVECLEGECEVLVKAAK